jgi:hypothetical protein
MGKEIGAVGEIETGIDNAAEHMKPAASDVNQTVRKDRALATAGGG